MLNVKKVSIIKAALFGLVLSNAGIAAGELPAGEPAEVAAPVPSPFLMSLHGLAPQGFIEAVYEPVRKACNAGEHFRFVDALMQEGDVVAAQAQEARLDQIFNDIALTHPISQRDRHIFKILGEGRGFMDQGIDDAISNGLGELTVHYPDMINPEKNLWLLLCRFQYDLLRHIEGPQGPENALRDALDVYHDALAAAAIGHADEDMGGM